MPKKWLCALDERQHHSRRMIEKSNFNKFGKKPIQTSTRIEAARMHATLFLILGIMLSVNGSRGKRTKFQMFSPVMTIEMTKN